jgi:hypothetical protein
LTEEEVVRRRRLFGENRIARKQRTGAAAQVVRRVANPLIVVRAAQRKGHVVGFLGDGINDGAALHGAANSNFGNMLSAIGASAWLPFLPKAPVQVRWGIGNIGRYMLFLGPISRWLHRQFGLG